MLINPEFTEIEKQLLYGGLLTLSCSPEVLIKSLPRRVHFECTQSLTTLPIQMIAETTRDLVALNHRFIIENHDRGSEFKVVSEVLDAVICASMFRFQKMYDLGHLKRTVLPRYSYDSDILLWGPINYLSKKLLDLIFEESDYTPPLFPEKFISDFFRTHFGIPREPPVDKLAILKAALKAKRATKGII